MSTLTGRGLPSTGPNLIYTDNGQRCYAYSGKVTCTDTETDLINSITGPDPIKVRIAFSYAESTQGDNIRYRIRLGDGSNPDNIIWEHTIDHSFAPYQYPATIHLILPPTTEIKLTAQNTTDTSNQLNLVVLAGKVV